ncbi:uncharacterized protein [Littorina saxatilis]|uniref:uncharacterized protein isoform X2 n=1 Tax=Littorina saxatilis TaxID=31220 RepID=UPI0038B4E17D
MCFLFETRVVVVLPFRSGMAEKALILLFVALSCRLACTEWADNNRGNGMYHGGYNGNYQGRSGSSGGSYGRFGRPRGIPRSPHERPSYDGTTYSRQTQKKLFATCSMMPDPAAPVLVTGTVRFEQTVSSQNQALSQLQVAVQLRGFETRDNNVDHGMHVHMFGDIRTSCADAGGHYNPTNMTHGSPFSAVRHVGDLGNIFEDGGGQVNTVFMDPVASLVGEFSIFGRGLVVHAGRDDLGLGTGENRTESLKTGNAGARLACCVIAHAADPQI